MSAFDTEARRPLYEIDPLTGATIEVFFADRSLETYGWHGAGWFWWARQRGFAPDGPRRGPFATMYAAYRDAVSNKALEQCAKTGITSDFGT